MTLAELAMMSDWANRQGMGGTPGVATVAGIGVATQGLPGDPDPGNALAILQDVVDVVADIPGAVHNALANDSVALMANLVTLGIAMHNVMAEAEFLPNSAKIVLKVAGALDALGDLQERAPGIANGNVKDFTLGLLDIASLTIAVARIPTGPAGIVIGAAADAALVGLRTLIDELPDPES
ncbi:hypothetical protein EUA04_08975 [Mycolicibacterium obuense]|uniref:Uncharacterized protein n=1 Tax=Mycolicibacterium obuense TaxID=1807 RepID=A0A4R5X9W1_9MYCO|nr:hypothetical protein EUA04_08975 [Mycolicibacterium obuense]